MREPQTVFEAFQLIMAVFTALVLFGTLVILFLDYAAPKVIRFFARIKSQLKNK